MNYERMEAQLLRHEGLRTTPYLDTVGKQTIGVGYNITDRGLATLERVLGRKVDLQKGITKAEALTMLRIDIREFEAKVLRRFPHYARLDEVRQRVVLDMAFNLGTRALGFKNTIKFVLAGNYESAAENMMKSLWADQVGDGKGNVYDRAERLSEMMRTGLDYTR